MSVIDEVKARLDIVDLVSATVSLRKTGQNYIGFCPFHSNTKTPSFVVFPETQTWRCFGACSEGGDIFSFLIKREGYGFKEALADLAQQAGIELAPPSPQKSAQEEQRNKLLELNAAAATYFHEILTQTEAGKEAREYLIGRGFTAETITTFQLGYALESWDAAKNHFLRRGYSLSDLVEAGLVVEKENGNSGYDRFRHRLMIPIRDARGRTIGFGARAMSSQELAKYINTPQTMLFEKSATLYGLDLARKHIRQSEQAVVVEGYMDVIQAYQRGAKNVVAQMGTALTEQQLKILKRITDNFVLALDSDTAGNAATLRGINVARKALDKEKVPAPTARGLIRFESHLKADIRIASLPPGKDPDDILKEGLSAWQQIIDQAVPVVDFYFQAVTTKLDMKTAKGKSTAVQELLPVIQDIGNKTEQEHYIQKLSSLIRIDVRTLKAELKRKKGTSRSGSNAKSRRSTIPRTQTQAEKFVPPPTAAPGRPSQQGLEEYCLSLVLAHPTTLARANEILEQQGMSGLKVNYFKKSDYQEIFKILQLWTAAEDPQREMLEEMVNSALNSQLNKLKTQWGCRLEDIPLEKAERDLTVAILRLQLQNISEQINELTFLQRESFEANDRETTRYYTEMIQQHTLQRRNIEFARDALSIMGQRRQELANLL